MITDILKGIDRCEVDYTDGWWETNTGATFGREKLIEVQGYECGLLQRIAELESQLADAQKNAARYQWLWTGFTPMGLDANGNHPWIFRTSPSELRGATLNQAIDAAMQPKEQAK